MPRALLSVSDKTGIVDLGRGLAARGYELASTGGTARALTDAGLPVTNVSDITGFPEMMDGRVKTLHPALHGGILARRDRRDDLEALAGHGIELVDIVVVNLYPFVKAAANPGHAVRRADRGNRHRRTVAGPRGRQEFPRRAGGRGPRGLPAPARRARHHPEPGIQVRADAKGHRAHGGVRQRRSRPRLRRSRSRGIVSIAPPPTARPTRMARTSATGSISRSKRSATCDTAKTPSRKPPGIGRAPAGLGDAKILQGKELSFTNLLDLDAAARIVLEFEEPAAVVVKHTNPCGAATGDSPADAYVRARDADRLAAFGGIVALNRPLDEATADSDCLDVHRGRHRAVGGRGGTRHPRAQGEHARHHRVVRPVDRRRRGAALDPWRDARPGARQGGRGAAPMVARLAGRGPHGRDQAAADRGGVGGAAIRVADLRAREVEHRDLHRRAANAGDRRGADEPRRCGATSRC